MCYFPHSLSCLKNIACLPGFAGVLTIARSGGTVAAQKQTLAWIERNARGFDIIGTFCSAKYRRAAVNRLVALLQQFWKFVDLFGPRVLGLTGGALRDRLVHQSRDIAWRQQCVGGSAPMLRRRQRGPAGRVDLLDVVPARRKLLGMRTVSWSSCRMATCMECTLLSARCAIHWVSIREFPQVIFVVAPRAEAIHNPSSQRQRLRRPTSFFDFEKTSGQGWRRIAWDDAGIEMRRCAGNCFQCGERPWLCAVGM
jgi:hypothetical protein